MPKAGPEEEDRKQHVGQCDLVDCLESPRCNPECGRQNNMEKDGLYYGLPSDQGKAKARQVLGYFMDPVGGQKIKIYTKLQKKNANYN